jgi:hypothetical protein
MELAKTRRGRAKVFRAAPFTFKSLGRDGKVYRRLQLGCGRKNKEAGQGGANPARLGGPALQRRLIAGSGSPVSRSQIEGMVGNAKKKMQRACQSEDSAKNPGYYVISDGIAER